MRQLIGHKPFILRHFIKGYTMHDYVNELKDRIYDLKDEMDVNNAVLDDKIDNLESKVNDIIEKFDQLLSAIKPV